MRYSDEPISKAISIIRGVSTLTVFSTSMPSAAKDLDSFIVVNLLPLNNEYPPYEAFLNVNIYKKDIAGYLDNAFLNNEKRTVMEAFEANTPIGNDYCNFVWEFENTMPDSAIGCHYVNIRLKVILLEKTKN
jgi:hypothetical protein